MGVVRSALTDASGVASLLSTAEAVVTEIKEEAPAGGAGGMRHGRYGRNGWYGRNGRHDVISNSLTSVKWKMSSCYFHRQKVHNHLINNELRYYTMTDTHEISFRKDDLNHA